MKRRFKKFSSVLLVITMLVTMFGTVAYAEDVVAAAENPYVFVHDKDVPYWHRSPHRYNYSGAEGNYIPAMYKLNGQDGSEIATYCCDLKTSIKEGTAYKRMNLEDSGYYSADNAKHIRFILLNGYQADSADVSGLAAAVANTTETDMSELTTAEALAATQYAVWYFANENPLTNLYATTKDANSGGIYNTTAVNPNETAKEGVKERIEAVYSYLISNMGAENQSAVANFTDEKTALTIETIQADTGAVYNVTARFKLEGTFNDSGDLKLTADLIKADGGKAATGIYQLLNGEETRLERLEADQDGYFTVTFTDIAEADLNGAQVALTIDGYQNVAKGIYFYEPVGGRDAAQSFVGVGEGKTPIHAETTIAVTKGTTEVSLVKYDASLGTEETPVPMEGVEFELWVQIGDNTAVKYPGIENAKTDADGRITWEGLVSASNLTYSYKEVVPEGYYSDNAEGTLIDGECATVKNCHELGNLSISKRVIQQEGASVTMERHYTFEVTLDYNKAQLVQNSREWPTVKTLVDSYGSLVAEYINSCEDVQPDDAEGAAGGENVSHGIESEPAAVLHPEKIQFTETAEGSGIVTATVSLMSGESVTLKGIPAGTAYTITELDADGNPISDDKISSFDGELIAPEKAAVSGTISENEKETAEAAYKNYAYLAATYDIDANVSITKNLDGTPSYRAFKFVLEDKDGNILQTVENATTEENAGKVDFEGLTFTEAGVYTYKIYEEARGGYICDDNVYTVVITVGRDDEAKCLTIESVKYYSQNKAKEELAAAQKAENETALAEGRDAVVIEAVGTEGLLGDSETMTFNNTTRRDYTSVVVKKVWNLDDGCTAPESVTVNLLKNGVIDDTVTLSKDNNWRYVWSSLSERYTWTVKEVNVPEGFTSSIEKSGLTYTITNDDVKTEEPAEPVEPTVPTTPAKPEGPDYTDVNDPEIPLIDLEDNDVPKGGITTSAIPKTGDEMPMAVVLLPLSGLALIALLAAGRKLKKSDK